MVKVCTPPTNPNLKNETSIFLAGSIEMGKAVNWQEGVIKVLDALDKDLVVLNPRRPDWDSSWEQKFENPHFFQQVTWESDCITKASYVFFYFDPATISSVSMLELGNSGLNSRTIVVCPEGFHRKGNVDIFCYRNDIVVFNTLTEGLNHLKSIL